MNVVLVAPKQCGQIFSLAVWLEMHFIILMRAVVAHEQSSKTVTRIIRTSTFWEYPRSLPIDKFWVIAPGEVATGLAVQND